MPITNYSRLDYRLITRFSGRKQEGYVSIVVDTEKEKIYVVPKDVEHIEFIARILNIRKENIVNNPHIASHLVPSVIEIKDGKVFGVVTGFSGAEIGYGVKHTKDELESAHLLSLNFINNGNVQKHEKIESRIIYKYMKK